MSISAFWQLYDSIIPKILTYNFGIDPTLRGLIMAMDNILALFLLPLFGVLSDKCDTKLGRRMPFVIFGTAAAAVSMMFLSVAATRDKLLWFVIALGVVLLSMGVYRSPAVALMPDLTPAPLRSKANAIINLMGALGGVYTLALIALLVKDESKYIPIFSCVAGLMAVAVAILAVSVNEKKIKAVLSGPSVAADQESEQRTASDGQKLPRDVMKSLILLLASVFLWFTAYNGVTSAYTVYAQEVWGLTGGSFASGMMIAMIAAVISFVPIGFISTAIGRKKVILGGIILITIAYISMFFVREYNAVVYALLVVVGIGWASINVNSYPMVVQMGSAGDVGKYTGVYYTFSMAAQIFTPILSGWLISKFGYKIFFPYAFCFSLAAFATFIFVRHGDAKPQKQASVLDNYGAMDD
jgi:Na+/melibiose symporter-like transporter